MNKAWWERPCVSQQAVIKQLQLWLDLSHLPSPNLWLNLFRSCKERLTMTVWTKSSKPACAFYPLWKVFGTGIRRFKRPNFKGRKRKIMHLKLAGSLMIFADSFSWTDGTWWNMMEPRMGLAKETDGPPFVPPTFAGNTDMKSRTAPKRHFCGSSLGKRRCFLVGRSLVQKEGPTLLHTKGPLYTLHNSMNVGFLHDTLPDTWRIIPISSG